MKLKCVSMVDRQFAGVAELADAIDLGSIGNTVQVQVLSPALHFIALKWRIYVV